MKRKNLDTLRQNFNIRQSKLGLRKSLKISRAKFALVKCADYLDLYKTNSVYTIEELISSSAKRSGPVALFTELSADFWIIPLREADNLRFKKERVEKFSKGLSRKRSADLIAAQEESSTSVFDINWNEYDFVIAMEGIVPEQIIQAFPSVTWAVMLQETGLNIAKQLLSAPDQYYDLYLSQRFSTSIKTILKKSHVIDWPYALNCTGSISRLYSLGEKDSLVVADCHEDLDKLKFVLKGINCDVWKPHGNATPIREVLQKLSSAQVFCCVNPTRKLWGNSILEAAAAGCIIVGNPRSFINASIILPDFAVDNYYHAAERVKLIIESREEYESALERQNELLDWFGFKRPLIQVQNWVAKKEDVKALKRFL